MSQRDMAAEMTRRGWKWSHVTVGSVERGERPLRASEALGVATILNIPVEELVAAQDSLRLREGQRSVLFALTQLQAAVSRWDSARLELAVLSDELGHRSEDADVISIDGMGFVSVTAEEVVRGVHNSDIHSDLDREQEYWRSRGTGPWVESYIKAEVNERGEYPAEA
jgi:hypothetical protein